MILFNGKNMQFYRTKLLKLVYIYIIIIIFFKKKFGEQCPQSNDSSVLE